MGKKTNSNRSRIVIWGAGGNAANLVNRFVDAEVEAFLDNNAELWESSILNVPIISPKDAIARYDPNTSYLLALNSARSVFSVMEQLRRIEPKPENIGIIKPNTLWDNSEPIQLAESDETIRHILWFRRNGQDEPVIPRIEVNLTDNCNLKCKACTHFSSIFADKSYCDFDAYLNDLKKLRKVGKMLRLRLLGGEPLLVEGLERYLAATRELFPESEIELVTNGLLIPQQTNTVMSAIQDNHICVTISPYKPTLKMKEKIIEKLKQWQIRWHFLDGEITEFYRNLTADKIHDAKRSSEVCLSAACTFLRNGKLYKCPVDGLIDTFAERYGLHYDVSHGVDLSQTPEKLYQEIVKLALEPVEMCQYCSEQLEFIPWQVKADPELNEWLYRK